MHTHATDRHHRPHVIHIVGEVDVDDMAYLEAEGLEVTREEAGEVCRAHGLDVEEVDVDVDAGGHVPLADLLVGLGY